MAKEDGTRNQHGTGWYEGAPFKPPTQEEINNILETGKTAGKYLKALLPLTIIFMLIGLFLDKAAYFFILEAVTYLFTALSIAAFVLWFRAKDIDQKDG